jgi:serine/threonine protein kinase
MYGHAGYRWSIPVPKVFDQMPLANGQAFAGYRILRRLGSGGMGEVYLAQHPRLPRQDALKVLGADISSDADYRARFDREADLASTLWHPNIIGVHDRGEADGQLWISMDYVEGLDAARLLASQSPSGLHPKQVANIVSAVASALDYAHERKLLHRDVKPANIMITTDEQRILLADFGIARSQHDISGLTATNFTVGTMAYAAPEQLMGQDLDGRADQYALAATAYYLLTGSHLFPHSNPAVVISHHLTAAPPALADIRPELAALDSVLAIALAKHPDGRFSRCLDFATKLSERIDVDAESDRSTEAGPTVAAPAAASKTHVTAAGLHGKSAQPGLRSTAPHSTTRKSPLRPKETAPSGAGPTLVKQKRHWSHRIFLAAAIVAVAVFGAIVAVATTTSTPHGPQKVSREDQIRDTIHKFDVAVQTGDLAALRGVTCGNMRDEYVNYDEREWNDTYRRVAAAKQYPVVASIDQVVVNGQHAEANITTFMAYAPQVRSARSMDLQDSNGQWKICEASTG